MNQNPFPLEDSSLLTSPICHLPVETLAEIFICCLPEERYAVRDLEEAPLLLTTVSRYWRQVAINTPALWRSLHIFLPATTSSEAVCRRSLGASIWLDRSGCLPLSISLCLGTKFRQLRDDNATEWDKLMVETLLKFSSRVKELTFCGPGTKLSDIATHLARIHPHTFPIMEMFCVRITRVRRSRDADLPFASLIQRMPSLNNLAIINAIQHGPAYIRLECIWDHLTELMLDPMVAHCTEMARFTPSEILTILGRTHRLQSLTLRIDIVNWKDVNTTVVNLPDLRNMHIKFDNFGLLAHVQTFLPNFFRSIVCPSLELLHPSWEGAMQLTGVPFAALESLREVEALLLHMPLTPDALLECLSLVPKLKFLEIANRSPKGDIETYGISPSLSPTLNDSVLDSLGSTSSDEGMLCPDLQHIRIICTDDISSCITLNALLTFLESRKSLLQSCDVFLKIPPQVPNEEETRRIRILVDSGMKLRIRYPTGQLPAPPCQIDLPAMGIMMQGSIPSPQQHDLVLGLTPRSNRVTKLTI